MQQHKPLNADLHADGAETGAAANIQVDDDKHSDSSESVVDKAVQRARRREQQQVAAARHKSLPLQYVETNIFSRIERDTAYSDLFMYIPFVALFMVFFLAGRDIEKNHMAGASNKELYMYEQYPNFDQAVEELNAQGFSKDPNVRMERLFEDAENLDHFKRWFTGVVMPGTWDCDQPDYSRSTLVKRGQMQYLGAMKVRVLVMRNDSCTFNPNYGISLSDKISGNDTDAEAEKMECYFKFWPSGLDKRYRCNKRNPANVAEFLWKPYGAFEGDNNGYITTGSLNIYPAGGYQAQLPFNATCNMVSQFFELVSKETTAAGLRYGPGVTDELDECNIFRTKHTRLIVLEWFQYAANTDTFMLNKLFYEVTSGGAWVANHQIRMFPVWTIKRLWMSIFDIFFFLFVLFFFYRLMYDWVTYYRTTKKILGFLTDIWNLLEFANIVTLLAVFILRWIWWSKSRQADVAFPFTQKYPIDLDGLVLVFSSQIYANSVNVVITVLKTLKYFRLNNRLNVLTRTFAVAQQDIIGILILFVFIVLGYAITGTVLYGGHLFAFKNVNSSFSALMFLLLGQFDYPAMRALQPLLTALFFFSYTILSLFLLLNFIIAILGDGFSTVAHNTALEPLDQAIVRQIYLLKDSLTFRNLKKAIELRRKGKTRGQLLRELYKYIREHVDLIGKNSPELLDSDLPMYKSDFKHWLPEQLYSDLGEHYLDVLWADMLHDYSIDVTSNDYQMHKDIEAAMIETMKSIFDIESKVAPLTTMDRNLEGIEELVDVIVTGKQRGGALSQSSFRRSQSLRRGPRSFHGGASKSFRRSRSNQSPSPESRNKTSVAFAEEVDEQ